MDKCPLCYPFKKTTKPADRPPYAVSYGKRWYTCRDADKFWRVTTQHRTAPCQLTWDEYNNLGFELRSLLWQREHLNFTEAIVSIKYQDGHYIMTIEHAE
jgi:hypothetical protein